MASESIKRKLAALLKMTSAAGCTEAEALAAAEKAAELMREHGLTETDITIGQATARAATRGKGARDVLWDYVAYCTNTSLVFTVDRSRSSSELLFIGPDPGPEIAAYLVAVLNRAVDTGIAEFKAATFYRRRRTDATRRAAVRDFTMGIVWRLSKRLVEIFAPSIDKEANAVAVKAREELVPTAKPIGEQKAGKVRFDDAVWSGWDAGKKVNLSKGVAGGAGEHRQIGGA